MPVQYHCTVCKMCPDIQKHSKKNVRILFIVKSEFPGDNVYKYYSDASPQISGIEKRQHDSLTMTCAAILSFLVVL